MILRRDQSCSRKICENFASPLSRSSPHRPDSRDLPREASRQTTNRADLSAESEQLPTMRGEGDSIGNWPDKRNCTLLQYLESLAPELGIKREIHSLIAALDLVSR